MTREHWKIFVQHAHAVNRLANAVAKAAENGRITNRRAVSFMHACNKHEEAMERLIAQVERAGVK